MTEERPLERRGHNPARLQGVAAEPGGLGQGGGGLGVEGRHELRRKAGLENIMLRESKQKNVSYCLLSFM